MVGGKETRIPAKQHPVGGAGKRPVAQVGGIKMVRSRGTRGGGDTRGIGREGGGGEVWEKQVIHRINIKGLRAGGGRKIASNVDNHGGSKADKNGAPGHSNISRDSRRRSIRGFNCKGDSNSDSTAHGNFKTGLFQGQRDVNFQVKGTEQHGMEILGIQTGRQEAANRKGKAKAACKGVFALRGTPRGSEVMVCLQPTTLAKRWWAPTPGRLLEGPSEHREHPRGENDGAQGANARGSQWISRDSKGKGQGISRNDRRNGVQRQSSIQRDGTNVNKSETQHSAPGRGALGASQGVQTKQSPAEETSI